MPPFISSTSPPTNWNFGFGWSLTAYPIRFFESSIRSSDVVKEERRLRTDSTPTGKFQEEFESIFWESAPYSWPVVGWPSDLDAITREEARAYFDINYAPNNITACLVGDFDPPQAIELAKKYFGRLKRGPKDPAPAAHARGQTIG